MTAPNVCGRCGIEAPPDRLRLSLVNLAKEAREDGYPHAGSDYAHALRCRDRDACRARVRRDREAQEGTA